MKEKPLLSVVCATYNHEKYLSQAIESFLSQKTSFPIEIIIGEDCSTDRTREICLEYQNKHPDIIKLILWEKNVGAMKNHLTVIESARGKYLANCEGDDYWTDPQKIQKQVDFLEKHPEYSFSGHNVAIKYESINGLSNEWSRKWSKKSDKEGINIEDILRYGGCATCSLVWKRGIFGKFPDWFSEQKAGDWSLQILCASKGLMKYFNEPMGVYRVHDSGAYGNLVVKAKRDGFGVNEYLYKGMQQLLDCLDAHFNYKYKSILDIARNYNNLEIFSRYAVDGDFENSKKYARKLLPVLFKFPLKIIFTVILKLSIMAILPERIAIIMLNFNLKRKFSQLK